MPALGQLVVILGKLPYNIYSQVETGVAGQLMLPMLFIHYMGFHLVFQWTANGTLGGPGDPVPRGATRAPRYGREPKRDPNTVDKIVRACQTHPQRATHTAAQVRKNWLTL